VKDGPDCECGICLNCNPGLQASDKPEFVVIYGMQDQNRVGLNPFALQLVAESFAQNREGWGETKAHLPVCGKDRLPVWITLSNSPPEGVNIEDNET
jgi:hypothetical protein